jgi:hypothetical protein
MKWTKPCASGYGECGIWKEIVNEWERKGKAHNSSSNMKFGLFQIHTDLFNRILVSASCLTHSRSIWPHNKAMFLSSYLCDAKYRLKIMSAIQEEPWHWSSTSASSGLTLSQDLPESRRERQHIRQLGNETLSLVSRFDWKFELRPFGSIYVHRKLILKKLLSSNARSTRATTHGTKQVHNYVDCCTNVWYLEV